MTLYVPIAGTAHMSFDEPTQYDIECVKLGTVQIFQVGIDGFEKLVVDKDGWYWYNVYESELVNTGKITFHSAWVG